MQRIPAHIGEPTEPPPIAPASEPPAWDDASKPTSDWDLLQQPESDFEPPLRLGSAHCVVAAVSRR